MSRFMTISLLATFSLAACELLEEDPVSEDTGAEDTGSDDTGSDDTGGEDTVEYCQVRFLDLFDGDAVTFTIYEDDSYTTVIGTAATLNFSQYAAYQDVPVGDFVVAVELESGIFTAHKGSCEEGAKYTASTSGMATDMATQLLIKEDIQDLSGLAADHTRFTLINMTPDETNGVYAQLVYNGSEDDFVDFYEENGEALLMPQDHVTVDLKSATSTDGFVAQWGTPATYYAIWEGTSLVTVAPGKSLDVYLTCTKACNTSADRFLVGIMEDGTTFTTEVLYTED